MLWKERKRKLYVVHYSRSCFIKGTIEENFIRNIAGKDVEFFKNKLDKVLAYYPDVPRCSEFDHTYDRSLHKSNSLYDHYRDERYSRVINSITKKSLGV